MTAHVFLEEAEVTAPAISPLKPGGRPGEIAAAGQWSLIWRKFARNKVAVASGIVILALYFIGAFAE